MFSMIICHPLIHFTPIKTLMHHTSDGTSRRIRAKVVSSFACIKHPEVGKACAGVQQKDASDAVGSIGLLNNF